MGTRFAPQYAKLFMAKLEQDFLASCTTKPLAYFRYINDILIIWTDTEQKLIRFHEQFNNYHPTIYFKLVHSSSHIHFLDTTIYIKDNTLHTTIYRKPTDKPSYLMPYATTESVLTPQKGISTLKSSEDFIDQGYNPRVKDHNIHRATKVSRSQLLKYKQKRETDRVPLVTTYNPQLKALRKIARDLQGTLQKDNRLHTIFSDPPLLAFRQPPNPRKLIIRSSLSGPTNNGTHPCGRKRYKTCPHILSADRVQIPGTIEEYYIHDHYTCLSSNVVNAITCTKCPTRGIYGERKRTKASEKEPITTGSQ
ncbi:hypothetical protein XELAEV_18043729mg [Xenopus laevis]|uniref:Reverse transcriptase domain-containing protein n=1 Tax=Xenopus laevis TaxID=8355 RepID=A0A974H2M8_XENLA|nr:hypothetical protein XELAEV_18043729mg [Xenopus laevis]